MIKIGVSISTTAAAMAAVGQLDVDYIVWYGQIGLTHLDKVLPYKPLLLHDLSDSFWLNYEDPFDETVMQTTRTLLDQIQCPWFSTGIGASAEPQAHRHGPYREADEAQRQSRETVTTNILRHGKRLKEWLGMPLLLENFNYHPTNAYDYICEPSLFTDLVSEIDCGMLLDLGHARISAYNMAEWRERPLEEYLAVMPLARVREVHFNRPGWQEGQRVDLHQPICQDDLEPLRWVLDHAPVEAVTLEIETVDAPTLLRQIEMLHAFLG